LVKNKREIPSLFTGGEILAVERELARTHRSLSLSLAFFFLSLSLLDSSLNACTFFDATMISLSFAMERSRVKRLRFVTLGIIIIFFFSRDILLSVFTVLQLEDIFNKRGAQKNERSR